MKHLFFILISFSLISCGPNETLSLDKTKAHNPQTNMQTAWPPLSAALQCLSPTGPILSLHRGRDKMLDHADNSWAGLKAARSSGALMVEVDISRLKDGTHILYHDGVWENSSTGQGVVSATTWEQSQKFLLKSPKGKLTAQRIASFENVLKWADKKLYLEIDFKSSANPKTIIKLIRKYDMQNHVALIAYNKRQALSLSRLASDMMISAPARNMGEIRAYQNSGLKKDSLLVWLGTKNYNERFSTDLKEKNIASAFGMFSPRYARDENYFNTSIIVTDYQADARKKLGIKKPGKARLKNCKL